MIANDSATSAVNDSANKANLTQGILLKWLGSWQYHLLFFRM